MPYVRPFFVLFLALAAGGAPALDPTFPVVDTGQVLCYGTNASIPCPVAGQPFHGQDAQHAGRASSYTVSGDGLTVLDGVTGLTWQRSPDTDGDGSLTAADKLSWAGAQARPAALNASRFGGTSDWRLPTIKELYSLIDFRGTDPSFFSGDTSGLTPFIDATVFGFAYGAPPERVIDSQYASSTLYVGGTGTSGSQKLFGVNFADGRIKGYDLTLPDGTEKTFFVQCVRGNPSYGANRFADNGDQTVTDAATGLEWAKADSGAAMTWQEALAWAEARNAEGYLGHADWRLPDAKELQGLLDYARSPDSSGSAAIDPVFAVTPITNEGGKADFPWYWASTTHASDNGSGASGVYLCFGRCGGWMKATPSASCYTWTDVHGAGAQRGDPKTPAGKATIGTACNGGTAYGRGPQGDVQRGANFVRLVRGAGGSAGETCTADETTLCLYGGRFRVQAGYTDYSGTAGTGRARALTTDSGYFWFFDADNVELLAKMVNGCSYGSRLGVYVGGLTDVETTIRVTDTRDGTSREYTKPLGERFTMISDAPFSCP